MAPFVTAIVVGVMSLFGAFFTTFFLEKVHCHSFCLTINIMLLCIFVHACVQIGRKSMLVGGGFMMALLAGIAATLVLAFNLEEENNDVIGYIVVCLVCVFVLVYIATW